MLFFPDSPTVSYGHVMEFLTKDCKKNRCEDLEKVSKKGLDSHLVAFSTFPLSFAFPLELDHDIIQTAIMD